jgi:Mrp family chromosome partitioning ATPase
VAAQDLIISRRSSALPGSYLDSDPAADGPDGAAILFAVLRKRWLILLLIALACGGLAFLAAKQFGRNTASINSSMIFTGLPDSRQVAFDPLGPATGSEMIVNVQVLDKLIKRRGLGVTPVDLADYIQSTIGRSSSLLNLTLTWNDETEGISLLNDLMDVFIDEMAVQRKKIQRDHLQYLELTLLKTKSRVEDARQQLSALQRQQQQQLDQGGLTTEQYRSTLSNRDNTQLSIDTTKTEQAGMTQQIQKITELIAQLDAKQKEIEKQTKVAFLRDTEEAFQNARQGFRPNSTASRQLAEAYNRIATFAKSPEVSDIERVYTGILKIVTDGTSNLSKEDQERLAEAFASIHQKAVAELGQIDSERKKLAEQRQQTQLRLILNQNQLTMYEERRAAYDKQAAGLREKITGVTATQLDQTQREVEEAEKLLNTLAVERDNLSQLADSSLREWTVSVPASQETTQNKSNHAKIFVLVFALSGLVLSAPLLIAEWLSQSGTPQVQFARSLRVPVLAERILEDFSPQQRRVNAQARLDADQMEALRLLTLRIQQSCHRPGSVVLFSSLDPQFSAAPLMAGVAECLADREERVLLVDAVCPQKSLLPVMNAMAFDGDAAKPGNDTQAQRTALALTARDPAVTGHPGLSEYLSDECEDFAELIRPTNYPGVDIISNGRIGFPREAMASSCLTELLNTCRRNYTMVLVHGPTIDFAADLQMLTARADGVVLAATKQSGKDQRVRAVVQDLLDLGAPIVGLVA